MDYLLKIHLFSLKTLTTFMVEFSLYISDSFGLLCPHRSYMIENLVFETPCTLNLKDLLHIQKVFIYCTLLLILPSILKIMDAKIDKHQTISELKRN